jgi:hemerythrin-like domain-containing protein
MNSERLIAQMKGDHDRVLSEIAALEKALGSREAPSTAVLTEIPPLLDLLERQFRTHMAAEDEILYPELLRALPASAGSVEPLRGEHAELRLMLERLRASFAEPAGESRDEELAVQVHDLADLLRIHLRKEESLVFGIAARLLDDDAVAAVLARMTTGARAERAPVSNPTDTKGSTT